MTVQLKATNKDEKKMEFTCALHNYFLVKDIRDVQIRGLQGRTFIDKTQMGKRCKEEHEMVKFGGFTDRRYLNTSNEVEISDNSSKIVVKKQNFSETVIWNIWSTKVKELSDMGENDWEKYVCVEPAAVEPRVSVAPHQSWTGTQIISKY
eukprot:TRINITY_DN752_c0_g1_i1.p1 TRINITY_DN752_c0_g1~~TRINITY_DN752_c0_g1_i1.p1  ORF type:complete len:150 (+),score=44.08 TRINITY_DN752_c0_g1_i1:537-986(+)